jgi:tyrosyl-tRNA synthetase
MSEAKDSSAPAETGTASVRVPADLRETWERIHDGVVELIPQAEMLAKLQASKREGRPLRIKLGADPSRPDLHVGHVVVLRKLRLFQELGHTVVFIIGDGTGRIGDPTDRSQTRPSLGQDEVRANAQTYFNQVYKVLDESNCEIEYNSRWFQAMGFDDVVRLLAGSTVARMLERDDFQKRFSAGQAIHIHEFMYPLMQGYDSVMVRADVEVGGTDQKFNLLVGRDLQRDAGQEPQAILTMPLLVGLDGVEKMSKSLGNYIGITEPPEEIYGKAMSIGDDLMETYFHLALGYSASRARALCEDAKAGRIHPRELKARLARELTAQFHSAGAAGEAQERFNRVHRERQSPDEIEERTLPVGENGALWICKALAQASLAGSNSEARRLIRGGGLRIDGQRVGDEQLELSPGVYEIQAGKRRFLRLTLT